ncbi:MAG: viperin family antiviral radical SAM protein, partial [Promethearchaeia archaeon]
MILESINLHFWPHCNFTCKYCFTQFKNFKRILTKNQWFQIIGLLRDYNVRKINFVGGEPTLCPFLGELIIFSKNLGLITSIVSNGTGITQKFIDQYGEYIDWIGLSLDSGNEIIQKALGRGNGNYVRDTIEKSKMIKKAGIKLKINTVVTRLNYLEDMQNIIGLIKPDRWKVFQILEIKG